MQLAKVGSCTSTSSVLGYTQGWVRKISSVQILSHLYIRHHGHNSPQPTTASSVCVCFPVLSMSKPAHWHCSYLCCFEAAAAELAAQGKHSDSPLTSTSQEWFELIKTTLQKHHCAGRSICSIFFSLGVKKLLGKCVPLRCEACVPGTCT